MPLLERGLSRNEVEGVYRRYGPMLERRCRLLLRDDVLAEDAMQELLTTLLRRGQTFREATSPYAWLCRAAERASLDLLRRGKRGRDALSLDDVDVLGPAPGVDAEARRAVLESLERLDDDARHLAVLLFVDGLTQAEAAGELGVSRVTVNKRAAVIRAQLQLVLRDESGPLPEEVPS
jgi:RNA polymerase sigma-70 factor (ECF subfamily)